MVNSTKLSQIDPEQSPRTYRGIGAAQRAGRLTVRDSDGNEVQPTEEILFEGARVYDGDAGLAVVDLNTGVQIMRNNSGADVTQFSVVVVDQTADRAFTTTTTQGVTDVVGVTQAAIANGQMGPVLFSGPTRVAIAGAVTRGDFLETSTTAAAATTAAARHAGSFGQLIEGNTATSAPTISDTVIGSQVTTIDTAGTSIVAAMPTTVDGVAVSAIPDGYALHLAVFVGSSSTVTTPTGWTRIGATAGFWHYRRIASSEPSSYTVSWTTSSRAVAIILVMNRLDTTSLVAGSAFDSTNSAASVSGLASDTYFAIAAVQALSSVPSGWLEIGSGQTHGVVGTAAIVQKAAGAAFWGSGGGTLTLPSPVTAGNVLLLVESTADYFGNHSVNLSPHMGTSTGPFRTFTELQRIEVGGGAYGNDQGLLAYRYATGDEQTLVFGGLTNQFHVTVYEVSGSAAPTAFEIISKTLQAGSTAKTIGTLSAGGDAQIIMIQTHSTSADQTLGAGWTQRYQGTGGGVATAVGDGTTNPTATASGGVHNWGGFAVGLIAGAIDVSGTLVGKVFTGTSVTSPFTGASYANDALIVFNLLEDPYYDFDFPWAILFGVPDNSQGLGVQDTSGTVVDAATTILQFDPGIATDVSAGTVRVRGLPSGTIGASAYATANTSLTNNASTSIALAGEEFDTDGFHNTVTNNNRMTVPAGLAGYYLAVGQITYDANTTGERIAIITKNGNGFGNSQATVRDTDADASGKSQQPVWIGYLNAGDWIDLSAYQSSGGARSLDTNYGRTWLKLIKLDSGRVGTGVGAKASHSTTQLLNTATFTALSADSEAFDTDAFHSVSSNTSRMTVPTGMGGKYLITALVQYAANTTGSRLAAWYKNGAQQTWTREATALGGGDTRVQITVVAALNGGDYVEIYGYQDSGGNLNAQLLDFSVMRLDSLPAGGGYREGTAFPTGPATNDKFYRTDKNLLCFYNGTRWLTTELFRAQISPYAAESNRVVSATTAVYDRCGTPYLMGGSDLWIETFTTSFYVSSGGTALDASNKWAIDLKAGRDATNNTLDTIATNTVNSGSSAVDRRITATVNALLDNGTVHDFLEVALTKTGTPGNFQGFSEITYRVVVP